MRLKFSSEHRRDSSNSHPDRNGLSGHESRSERPIHVDAKGARSGLKTYQHDNEYDKKECEDEPEWNDNSVIQGTPSAVLTYSILRANVRLIRCNIIFQVVVLHGVSFQPLSALVMESRQTANQKCSCTRSPECGVSIKSVESLS